MIEYKHTPDMGEISGFGGEYEAACQQMLHQGVCWLLAHPGADPKFHSLQNVYGSVSSDNEDAKQLMAAVLEGLDGVSGAMFHAVIGRLMFVASKGWDAYSATLREHEAREGLQQAREASREG